MKKIFSLFLLGITAYGLGQTTKVTTYTYAYTDSLRGNLTYLYPIVNSGNTTIDTTIQNGFVLGLFSDGAILPLDTFLRQAAEEGLVSLDYTVSLNNNNILSIQINRESCGAYCSAWTSYFNFDLKTGNFIDIPNIIKDEYMLEFIDSVNTWKNLQLNSYLEDLSEDVANNNMESETYNWVKESVEYCKSDFPNNAWLLSNDTLIIKNDCMLPNAIKCYNYYSEIKVDFINYRKYFKESFLKKFE